MNISTIKTALWTWANTNIGTGVTVVWADQASPRPVRPYATIKIASVNRVSGQDEQRFSGTNGVLQIVGHRRLNVSMQIRGASIAQNAHNLQMSLSKPSVLATLRASSIAVSSEGNLTNLTEFLETSFEEIYNFDVEFLTLATLTDDNGYILTTELEGFGESNIIG
jgi:hypothetical protein